MADFAKLLPYSGLICIKFAHVRDAYNSATNRIKAEVFMTQASAPDTQSKGGVIQDWRPEEPDFWQQIGQKTAQRNLWISIPCLLLAFCVWMLFSAVAVNL
ncbi:MAG: hypothetical protein L0K39_05830, partial [Enterobacterales bacterium]|nr:hypothetical protein [Enterobacterales bacterium]